MKEIIKSIIISPEYWAIMVPALVAIIMFFLTKKYEIDSAWKQQKLNHYKVLLSSFSDFVINPSNQDARMKFSLASNTIALVASQGVIHCLMALNAYMILPKEEKRSKDIDDCLKKLLLEIRKDIGLSAKDNDKTFEFHLVQ